MIDKSLRQNFWTHVEQAVVLKFDRGYPREWVEQNGRVEDRKAFAHHFAEHIKERVRKNETLRTFLKEEYFDFTFDHDEPDEKYYSKDHHYKWRINKPTQNRANLFAVYLGASSYQDYLSKYNIGRENQIPYTLESEDQDQEYIDLSEPQIQAPDSDEQLIAVEEVANYQNEQQLQVLTKEFFGRERLKKQAKQFIKQNNSGTLFYTGQPGIGKSAFMATLYEELEQLDSSNKKRYWLLFPYFIRRNTETAQASFMLTVLNQWLNGILQLNDPIETDISNLRVGLQRRLQKVQSICRTQKVIFLIDGLDEGVEETLFSYLPQHDYPNVIFIYSTRLYSTISSKSIGRKDLQSWYLTARNRRDFVEYKIEELERPDVYNIIEKFGIEQHYYDEIYQRSQGNPKYLELLGLSLKSGAVEINQIADIPSFSEDFRNFYAPIIHSYTKQYEGTFLYEILFTITAAKDYLSLSHLKEILDISIQQARDVTTILEEVLTTHANPARGYQLFHESLRDYLLSTPEGLEITKYQHKLLNFCKRWRELDEYYDYTSNTKIVQLYPIQHYTSHLKEVVENQHNERRKVELYELVEDEEFQHCQIELTRQYFQSFQLLETVINVAQQKNDTSILSSVINRALKLHQLRKGSGIGITELLDQERLDVALLRVEGLESQERIKAYVLIFDFFINHPQRTIADYQTELQQVIQHIDRSFSKHEVVLQPFLCWYPIIRSLRYAGVEVSPLINRLNIKSTIDPHDKELPIQTAIDNISFSKPSQPFEVDFREFDLCVAILLAVINQVWDSMFKSRDYVIIYKYIVHISHKYALSVSLTGTDLLRQQVKAKLEAATLQLIEGVTKHNISQPEQGAIRYNGYATLARIAIESKQLTGIEEYYQKIPLSNTKFKLGVDIAKFCLSSFERDKEESVKLVGFILPSLFDYFKYIIIQGEEYEWPEPCGEILFILDKIEAPSEMFESIFDTIIIKAKEFRLYRRHFKEPFVHVDSFQYVPPQPLLNTIQKMLELQGQSWEFCDYGNILAGTLASLLRRKVMVDLNFFQRIIGKDDFERFLLLTAEKLYATNTIQLAEACLKWAEEHCQEECDSMFEVDSVSYKNVFYAKVSILVARNGQNPESYLKNYLENNELLKQDHDKKFYYYGLLFPTVYQLNKRKGIEMAELLIERAVEQKRSETILSAIQGLVQINQLNYVQQLLPFLTSDSVFYRDITVVGDLLLEKGHTQLAEKLLLSYIQHENVEWIYERILQKNNLPVNQMLFRKLYEFQLKSARSESQEDTYLVEALVKGLSVDDQLERAGDIVSKENVEVAEFFHKVGWLSFQRNYLSIKKRIVEMEMGDVFYYDVKQDEWKFIKSVDVTMEIRDKVDYTEQHNLFHRIARYLHQQEQLDIAIKLALGMRDAEQKETVRILVGLTYQALQQKQFPEVIILLNLQIRLLDSYSDHAANRYISYWEDVLETLTQNGYIKETLALLSVLNRCVDSDAHEKQIELLLRLAGMCYNKEEYIAVQALTQKSMEIQIIDKSKKVSVKRDGVGPLFYQLSHSNHKIDNTRNYLIYIDELTNQESNEKYQDISDDKLVKRKDFTLQELYYYGTWFFFYQNKYHAVLELLKKLNFYEIPYEDPRWEFISEIIQKEKDIKLALTFANTIKDANERNRNITHIIEWTAHSIDFNKALEILKAQNILEKRGYTFKEMLYGVSKQHLSVLLNFLKSENFDDSDYLTDIGKKIVEKILLDADKAMIRYLSILDDFLLNEEVCAYISQGVEVLKRHGVADV